MAVSERYEPVMLIGAGATCEVWLGILKGAQGYRKPVVLKRAAAEIEGDIEAAEKALAAEAHLSLALNHPNLVHVYELIDTPEGVMLAMEYLSGFSLRSLMAAIDERQSVLPWPVAARIVADAAWGLDHAHNRAKDPAGHHLSITHCDVTPENLVVTEEGITKVLDFGIARGVEQNTVTGATIDGKLGYLAPEQAQGQGLDYRADVFVLGIVFHELLTGLPLFPARDVGSAIRAILNGPIPDLPGHVDPVVRDVACQMLVRDVRHRSLTMYEVADVLEVAVAGRGGTHRDVELFLRSELGEELDRRALIIKNLLHRPAQSEAGRQPSMELPGRATMAAVESVFELARTQSADPAFDGEAPDTLPEDTSPWHRRPL